MSGRMRNMKDVPREDVLTHGHGACPGCGYAATAKNIAKMLGPNTTVYVPASCLVVFGALYPQSAWKIPYFFTAFENTGAVLSGIKAAQRRRGIDSTVVGMAGDGGTFDIGLQALSGAAERNEDVIYVCLDNEAYMNTGIQRSGATGRGAATTTCPSGTCIPGKREFPKDFTKIIAAHELPYAAQASPHNWRDMVEKAGKGFECGGPAFINAITPCPRGWRYEPQLTVEIAKLAVETCVWPLYEYERGKWTLTGESKRIAEGSMEKRPVTDWIKAQGRFKHLQDPKWSSVVDEIQENVDFKWEELLRLSKQ